jgi:hypothetical protein
MNQKYIVRLKDEERKHLEKLIGKNGGPDVCLCRNATR